jgi:hypothetical protein
MKTIRHKATLYYYDGPQVFEACGSNGEYYIAVMVEPDGSHDQYLVAVVEPERLQQFRLGALDLRSLLTERANKEWFLTKASGGLNAPLALQPQPMALTACSYLPEPGFLLHNPPANADAVLGHAGLNCGCASGKGNEIGSRKKLV